MNTRTLSIAALTLLDVPPAEQVRIAAQTGFTDVGIRLIPATPDDPDYNMLGDTPQVRETLAALRDTGIGVTDVEIIRLGPDFTLDKRMMTFMETAARLGARHVLVAGNDENVSRSADNLAQLAEAGKDWGLVMNLEPMPWTTLRNIADAQTLISASGQKDIGIWSMPFTSGEQKSHWRTCAICRKIISTICNCVMPRHKTHMTKKKLFVRRVQHARSQ